MQIFIFFVYGLTLPLVECTVPCQVDPKFDASSHRTQGVRTAHAQEKLSPNQIQHQHHFVVPHVRMLAHLQRDSIPQAAQTCFHSLAHSRRVQPAGQPPGEHTLTHKSARKAMRLAAPHGARNTRVFVPALGEVVEESEVEDGRTGDTSTEPSDDESASSIESQEGSQPDQLGSADSSVNNSGMHESASSIESQEGSQPDQPDQPDQQEHQLPGEAVANDSSSSQECEDESNDTNKSISLTFGNTKCRP